MTVWNQLQSVVCSSNYEHSGSKVEVERHQYPVTFRFHRKTYSYKVKSVCVCSFLVLLHGQTWIQTQHKQAASKHSSMADLRLIVAAADV